MLTILIKKTLLAGSMGVAIALAISAVLPKTGYASPIQLAQETSLQPQTISVVGAGQASVPATEAAILLTYVSNSYPEYSDTGEVVTPATFPQPADLQSIVDAVKAEGIASDIKVSQEYDYQYLQMTIRLKNPTRDRVNKIKAAAAKKAIEEGNFSVSPSGVIYVTDSCEGLESTARERAMADAKAQAGLLAAASGLALGELSAVSGGSNFNYYGPSDLTCPTDLDKILATGDGNLGSFAGYNSGSSDITVNFSIYATYKVKE